MMGVESVPFQEPFFHAESLEIPCNFFITVLLSALESMEGKRHQQSDPFSERMHAKSLEHTKLKPCSNHPRHGTQCVKIHQHLYCKQTNKIPPQFDQKNATTVFWPRLYHSLPKYLRHAKC